MKLILFVTALVCPTVLCATPVVLWHGMGDSCCNPLSLGSIIKVIQEDAPGTYVHSLRIGKNFLDDTTNGFFMNANDQVSMACDLIASDPELANGYNAIGFSQGGQFLRAVAQRCPKPKMINLISLGGQHQGVYGLPHCLYPQHKWCDYLRSLLNNGAYWRWVQNQFVQAEYWHDPMNEDKYKKGSVFLAEINNEKAFNASYKQNLASLENFVMVKFEDDTMVQPVDTEWFGFYAPGQSINITGLKDSHIYKEDRLGLKKLDEEGKLKFLSVPGDHLQFSLDWFKASIIGPYLQEPSNEAGEKKES